MRSLSRSFTIGMLAFGLTAVSAESHAAPVCVVAGYPTVLEVGQAGAPGSPILLGGYLLASGDTRLQKIPIVGSVSLNDDGSVVLGWTSHFDWGSENWTCPVGDTVVNVSPTGDITYDTTFHGGEAEDCPNNFQGPVTLISCTDLLSPAAAAAPSQNGR